MKKFPSIKKNEEYRLIYNRGKSLAAGTLIVYVKDNDMDSNRLGISVSKKIGNSVVRHRFCRRIREIFRLNDQNTVQGKDIVVIARKQAAQADYHCLEQDYLKLLKDHMILKNRNE